MVAAQPRKRVDEAPPTPKHAQRQGSTSRRSRSTRAENAAVGSDDRTEPSTDPQDSGAIDESATRQPQSGKAVAVVSGEELKVGDRCWYGQETNTGRIEQLDSSGDALVKFAHGKSVWVAAKHCHPLTDAHVCDVNLLEPGTLVKGQTLQGKECQGEFTNLSMSGMVMLSSDAQFGKQRMLNPETLVRVEVAEPAKVATELATISTPDPELQSEAKKCNWQKGDRVRIVKAPRYVGNLATIKDIDGNRISVLPDGGMFAMDLPLSALEFVSEGDQDSQNQPPEVTETEIGQASEGADQDGVSEPTFSRLQSGGWVQIRTKLMDKVRQRLIDRPELATEFHGGDRPGWKLQYANQYLRLADYGDAIMPTAHHDGRVTAMGSCMGNRKVEAFLKGWLEATEPANATDNNPPAINETEGESIILPLLPTPHEIEAAIKPNNPKETIESLLFKLGFCSITGDDFYPDGEAESYRGWQITTESHEGALMAVNISDGSQWLSLPSEADDWFFGYRGHQQAIDWARQFIDCLVAAAEKASGQLNLLEPQLLDNATAKLGKQLYSELGGDVAELEDELSGAAISPQLSTFTHLPIHSQPSALSPQPSTLDQLATDINRLHSDCEQAIEIAQSAQASALEHAKEAGLLLLQAKQVCGHGKWEAWREANLQLPSSTATLYQRIADRFSELEEAGITSVKAAADYLKKARIKSATDSQTVAEMRPVTHEKDLVETLQAAQADFRQRKAAAEERAADNGSSIPELQTVPQDQIAAVMPSGWIQTKDGRNLNPMHYRAEEAKGEGSIAAVLTGYDAITGSAKFNLVAIPDQPTQEEVDEANWGHLTSNPLDGSDSLKWLDAEFEQSIELVTEWLGPDQIKKMSIQIMQDISDLGGLPVAILAIKGCDRDELLQMQEIVKRMLEEVEA